MTSVGLLVKSYRDDLPLAERLVASLDRHNVERLPTWIVVPDADVALFAHLAGEGREVLPESLLGQYLVDQPVAGIRPGYINQEIVKLAFWELGLADNVFTIDSDAVMVRDFGAADLMFDATTPYSILVEDNDLRIDPDYFATYWQGREASLHRIQDLMDFHDPRMLTCHGHQVLSSAVLRSLKAGFLEPRGWTYADMLAESPYEYSWYNFWLQKSRVIDIQMREPLMKVVHSAQQHVELAMRGITPADVARGYIGIVVNSNFARSWGAVTHDEQPEETLARYLPWSTLLGAVRVKTRSAIRGRLRGGRG